MELLDVMREAEGWIDSLQQEEVSREEYLAGARGEGVLELAGTSMEYEWSCDAETLLPSIEIRDGSQRWVVEMKRNVCPDVILYEWQCWDADDLGWIIDRICRERGRVAFP